MDKAGKKENQRPSERLLENGHHEEKAPVGEEKKNKTKQRKLGKRRAYEPGLPGSGLS